MGSLHFSSWPSGVPRELDAPQTSIWANLEASVSRAPERRAIVFYDRAIPYAELKIQCERLAGFLQQACGVKRGDRVAIYMQNSPQCVIAFYAVLRADAAVVPVNPMNLTDEVPYMLEDSGAKVLLAAQEVA